MEGNELAYFILRAPATTTPLTAKPRAKPPVDPRPNLNQSLQGNWENIGSCIMGEEKEEEEGEEVKEASYFESSNIQKTLQDLILLTRKSNLKLDLFFELHSNDDDMMLRSVMASLHCSDLSPNFLSA